MAPGCFSLTQQQQQQNSCNQLSTYYVSNQPCSYYCTADYNNYTAASSSVNASSENNTNLLDSKNIRIFVSYDDEINLDSIPLPSTPPPPSSTYQSYYNKTSYSSGIKSANKNLYDTVDSFEILELTIMKQKRLAKLKNTDLLRKVLLKKTFDLVCEIMDHENGFDEEKTSPVDEEEEEDEFQDRLIVKAESDSESDSDSDSDSDDDSDSSSDSDDDDEDDDKSLSNSENLILESDKTDQLLPGNWSEVKVEPLSHLNQDSYYLEQQKAIDFISQKQTSSTVITKDELKSKNDNELNIIKLDDDKNYYDLSSSSQHNTDYMEPELYLNVLNEEDLLDFNFEPIMEESKSMESAQVPQSLDTKLDKFKIKRRSSNCDDDDEQSDDEDEYTTEQENYQPKNKKLLRINLDSLSNQYYRHSENSYSMKRPLEDRYTECNPKRTRFSN